MDHSIPLTKTFYLWSIIPPISYILLILLFRLINLYPNKCKKGSRASDILSFQIVAGICLAYLGINGVILWFNLNSNYTMDNLIKDKYHAREEFVENFLLLPMLSYQFWQIILCFILNDLFDVAMIAHHILTFLLAYICLHPVLHYYVCFYFGLAEITNLPLTIIDTFKYFPDLGEKFYYLNRFCKYSFASLFFIIRIFYWTYITFNMLLFLVPLCWNGNAHNIYVIFYFLFAATFLTGLQYFWGYKIFFIVMKDFSDNKKKKETHSNSNLKNK